MAALPFMLYVGLTPHGHGVAPIVIAGQLGGAYALMRKRRFVAALATLPFVLVTLYIGAHVLRPAG